MTRDDSIYISSKLRRCLSLVARRRNVLFPDETATSDKIAEETILCWLKNSDEGKVVMGFIERQDAERKAFAEGKN